MKKEIHNNTSIQHALQSFVGPYIKDVKLSDRQKDAVQKLVCLPDEKFADLCEDIVNEIKRRSGEEHSSDGLMFEKLSRLSKEKFKSLAIDTLLVRNYRYPGSGTQSSADFLECLQQLIDELKEQSDAKKMCKRLGEMDFLSAIKEYNCMVQRSGAVDERVIAEIERKIEKEEEMRTTGLIGSLGQLKSMLAMMDSMEVGSLAEYRYRKQRIEDLIEEKDSMDLASRDLLLRNEVAQMMLMLVSGLSTKTNREYAEVPKIARVLETIRKDLIGDEDADVEKLAEELQGYIESLTGRLEKEGKTDKELIQNIRIHQSLLFNLKEISTKIDVFKAIAALVRDVIAATK